MIDTKSGSNCEALIDNNVEFAIRQFNENDKFLKEK